MVILCGIIAAIDIVFGITTIIIVPNMWYIGVSLIVSSIIFVYFAVGADTAFDNKKAIEELENKNIELGKKIIILSDALKIDTDKVLKDIEIKRLKSIDVSRLKPGEPVILLIDKSVMGKKNTANVISKGTIGKIIVSENNTRTVLFKVDGKDINIQCDISELENGYFKDNI